MSKQLILGSRGSQLALYQANIIRDILISEYNCPVEIKIIKTAGDKIDNLSFDKMEGKGFFTKELEEALLQKEIDLAVHSLKDLMTTQPDGLKLGAVGYRADRSEMLLIRKESKVNKGLLSVKSGGIIGTGSARRKCQIAHIEPSLKIKELRGNVPTRINKLRDGQYDAIIIAAAGVKRLNLDTSDLETIILDPEKFLPAPAQGILGIQVRDDDRDVESIVSQLNSPEAEIETFLERGLLAKFNAGCSLPLGVYSQVNRDRYRLIVILGISENDKWKGLKRVDIEGTDVSKIVKQAYDKLNSDFA